MGAAETILISMVNHKNEQMLGELLGTEYQIIFNESELPEDSHEGVSLIIMDIHSWLERKEEMKLKKDNEKPLFLPYLLVASSNDLKVRNDIWDSFDEVITIPITKMVLQSRVRVLLQTRRLSVQVNQLAQDKEMLMKEIHHRVKNNLMVISSLLNLQSKYIKDKAALEVFRESQHRARSMALIHTMLYQSTDLKCINFGDYITKLTQELFRTYVTSDNIHLNLDVGDILLDINTSIPLGLIVNELVSNSLKHAFPHGEDGVITVKFHKNNDHYSFQVADTGIGFPEDLDFRKTNSLGMRLVNTLTDQIDGEIVLNTTRGTCFTINFTEKEYGS